MTHNTAMHEAKAVFNKVRKEVIKLIPYLTIFSGIMVWSYLNNIGRLDLLIDAFSLNVGLISLLVSSVIFSLGIAITLILPSTILFLHHSLAPNRIKKPFFIPWVNWLLSSLYLALIFTPHIPAVSKYISPLNPFTISTLLLASIFITLMSTSIFNGEFKNNSLRNKVGNFFNILINSLINILAVLSVSIPITILLKGSSGESSLSVLIALLFLIAFSFLSFLPSIVYFKEIKNTPSIEENRSAISTVKKSLIAVSITIILTTLLFPSMNTVLINSSLHTIGIIDNKEHHFLINGEKYQPEMFPQHLWMTSTSDKIEKRFFILGVRMFSAGNKNLICPVSVSNLKNKSNGTNYDLIMSSANKNSVDELKSMTKTCVILDSNDAPQWDTFFDTSHKSE